MHRPRIIQTDSHLASNHGNGDGEIEKPMPHQPLFPGEIDIQHALPFVTLKKIIDKIRDTIQVLSNISGYDLSLAQRY